MTRNEILEAIEAKLRKLGVPPHCAHVRKVPSSIEASVVVKGGGL